jgi:zinc protease
MTESPPFPDLPPSLARLFTQPPTSTVLENGLTVVHQVLPDHPVVSTQVWIRTGSIHEGSSLGSGLSHFLEHMLFKGTVRRGPGEIAAETQHFGGAINAYTAYDRTVYYIDGPAEALDRSLDILHDMTLQATLPEEEVDREREVILREIDMTLDDPDRIVLRSLFSTAFRDHPFRFPVIGLRPLFEQVNRPVLHRYYQDRYQPDNMVLSVAGDFEPEALLEAVQQTFGQAPRRPVRPVLIPEEPVQLALRESRRTGSYQTARGLMAFKIPSMRHPEAPDLDILAAIIGSGQSGRLRQDLREKKGLVHDISASAWNPRQPGLFVIQYQSDPDKAGAAEEAIREALADYSRHGFSADELEKARRFAAVSEVHARQTASGLAARQGLLAAMVGDLQYPEQFFRRIHALSAEGLGDLARKTFREEHLTISSLGPDSRPSSSPSPVRSALPAFSETTLSNGARLLWQRDDRLPRTYLRYSGLGGCLYEAPRHRGATSLMATLLARDTRRRSAREVAEALEGNGGFLMDASGNNSFSLAVEVMPERVHQGLDTLREALLEPGFREETLIREREAQLAHLHTLHDEILDHGRLVLRERFYGHHPFGSDPAGNLESCARLDRASISDLYQRLVVAPNTVFAVTGDFDPDDLIPRIEAFMTELPPTPFAVEGPPFDAPAATGHHRETMDREQAVVLEAYPDVGITAETEIMGQLLDEILSDMSGPLFRSVREEQSLAYFVGAARLLAREHGIFYLYAGTHPSSADRVYDSFTIELDRIRSGRLEPGELESARTRLIVQNRFALQSPSTRAARAALNVLYGKPAMDWIHYEERLKSVTIDDLATFASRQLDPSRSLRLTTGPEFD